MKSQAFDYARPDSLPAVFALLQQHGDSAQILAGGQSLIPMMNLRLAQPQLLIDINDLPGLRDIALADGVVRIGALVTHRQLQDSPVVARHVPLLAAAVPHVAHVAIRNRGTLGGSLALADPAAEYPAVALALGATLLAQGPGGERRIAADDFFHGLYQTALQPGEILAAVEFPASTANSRHAFDELARRHGDFALVGLAAALQLDGTRITHAKLAWFGVSDRALLAPHAMAALVGHTLDDAAIAQAVQQLGADLSPNTDLQADAATRLHWARVLLGRALRQMRSAS